MQIIGLFLKWLTLAGVAGIPKKISITFPPSCTNLSKTLNAPPSILCENDFSQSVFQSIVWFLARNDVQIRLLKLPFLVIDVVCLIGCCCCWAIAVVPDCDLLLAKTFGRDARARKLELLFNFESSSSFKALRYIPCEFPFSLELLPTLDTWPTTT